jgi:asparagine synthase (glutamine-hydrolysing)
MCGICGIAGGSGSSDTLRRDVVRMTDTLVHRGPDSSGAWVDAETGVALGHRRLSILDLSSCGNQPMVSACGRFVIAYNGEVYNHLELRRRLEDAGVEFRGHSDTEVVVETLARDGIRGALEQFNGMFALAVWDRRERVLHLARDRMGEKPLYYGSAGRRFLFASELRALRAHPDLDREIDRTALALYLRHGYVPSPFSIYRGIRKLPPGTFLSVRFEAGPQFGEPEAYWSLAEAARTGQQRAASEPRTAEAAVDELDALLRDAVHSRMQADVPLGAFLSGGIDSSTVVALMQARSSRQVRTFSIGFGEAEFNEAEYAAAVARHLGTDHTELYVSAEDALNVVPRLPSMFDEPFGDSSQIPTFLVSQLARSEVTVSLSGDGGDELFAGYTRYGSAGRLAGLREIDRRIRGTLGRGIRLAAPAVDVAGGRARNSRWGQRFLRAGEILSSPHLEAAYTATVSYWGRDAVLDAPPAASWNAAEQLPWMASNDVVHRMMYLDATRYLPDDILVKVDRASMAVSLEARVPLLDHRVVEFAWSLPADLKVRDGVAKWPLRQVLYRYVPRELLERPKRGFSIPVAEWLRGPLRAVGRGALRALPAPGGGVSLGAGDHVTLECVPARVAGARRRALDRADVPGVARRGEGIVTTGIGPRALAGTPPHESGDRNGASVVAPAGLGREGLAIALLFLGMAWAFVMMRGMVTHQYGPSVFALVLLLAGCAVFRGTPRLLFCLAMTVNTLTVFAIATEQIRARGQPFSGGGDDQLFYLTAGEIGQQWLHGNWSYVFGFSHYSGYGYLIIGATLHLIFNGWAEVGPLMPRMLDAFVGATIAPGMYLTARLLRYEEWPRFPFWVGLSGALFPLLVYQSAVGLRDIWLAAGTVWFLYCLVRSRLLGGGVVWAWLLPALILVAMAYIRVLSAAPLIGTWGILLLGGKNLPHAIFLKGLLVLGTVLVLSLVIDRLLADLAWERLKYTAQALEQAGSGSIGARLLALPTPLNEVARFGYAALAPVPPMRGLGLVEVLRGAGATLWYFLLPFALAGLWEVRRRSMAVASGIAIFAFVLLLGIAFTSIDVRHKMPLYPVGILLALAGAYRLGTGASARLVAGIALILGVMGITYFLLKLG